MIGLALFCGSAGLIAGVVKFLLDFYRERHRRPAITVTIGDESIDLPNSFTDTQVAQVVALLKDIAAKRESPI